jgi:hypothetical protein
MLKLNGPEIEDHNYNSVAIVCPLAVVVRRAFFIHSTI